MALSPPPYAEITRQIITGDLHAAQAALERIVAADSRDARAHMLLAKVAAGRRDHAGEQAMLERAVALDPGNGEYHALLARLQVRAQDVEAAMASVGAALACGELSDLALDALAATYAQMGRHHEAAELLQRAVEGGSGNPAVHYNLGNNLRFTGDFTGARGAFSRAIELAPAFPKAHAALTSLGGITAENNNLHQLLALAATTEDPRVAIHLHHAIAKEQEALGDFDQAWAHLTEGKAQLRKALRIDPLAAAPMLDRLPAATGAALSALPPAGEASGPIFIVGMPRSGTTVLDRILSNHDQVVSIGESLYFAQLLKIASGSQSRDLIDAPVLAMIDRQAELRELGRRYAAHGAQKSGGAARFVDKFHLNFGLAGHLLSALPDSRILCIVRDPLDTIVSNYRQLFEFDSTLYNYSLEIGAAAEFYIRFRRLAAFWEKAAPGRFQTVLYEDLVSAPDATARPLFDFCGLAWQDGATAIERNTASVATASAVQVRSRINRNSIGNWRRYEPYLDAVKRRLADEGL